MIFQSGGCYVNINKTVRYLSLVSVIVLCFSVVSLGSAARSTYWDNSEHLNQTHAMQSLHALKSYTYDPPTEIIWSNDSQFRVRAYPSSYWDIWEFRSYYVTWNRSVWIDEIQGRDYTNHEYVTKGYINFNPKGTAEGELTVTWSEDGKHNDCDFSAITGFEKVEKEHYTHLSIWTSRVTYPEPC